MISAIILTKNEAQNLPDCLKSIESIDDRIVVDSSSADETIAIAEKNGARVYTNFFKSFGEQRNWALDNCAPKYDWILFIDADERSTPAFQDAVTAAIQRAPDDVAGFYGCWKLMFKGVWLKRCDSFPKWQLRVVRKGCVRFVDFGHGQKEGVVDGRLDYIREPYLHLPANKGLDDWVERHNRYAEQEAAARRLEPIVWKNIFSANGSTRNRAVKPLVSRIPGWPLLRFVWPYIFRLGFLEGRPGFSYCLHLARYERLIQVKMKEHP